LRYILHSNQAIFFIALIHVEKFNRLY